MIKKELEEKDNFFISQELSLVAALIAWDFPLISVDNTNPRKVVFIFNKTPELNYAVQAYWNETQQISPKKYFYALREAKSRIYGGLL